MSSTYLFALFFLTIIVTINTVVMTAIAITIKSALTVPNIAIVELPNPVESVVTCSVVAETSSVDMFIISSPTQITPAV